MIGRNSFPLAALATALLFVPPAVGTPFLSFGAGTGDMTATFDNASGALGNSYSEGGLTFTGSSLGITTFPLVFNFSGNFPFGWNNYNQSPGLITYNPSWVTIGANGATMSSFSFQYGNDWNQTAIEFGLYSPVFQWQTLRNGAVTGSGSLDTGLNFGMYLNITGDTFDTVKVRSITAPYGDENHIGLDNVSVQTAVPDASGELVACFVLTCAGLEVGRRRLKRRAA